MTAPSIIAKGLGGLEPLVGLQVKTYGRGRICAVCGVPLSRYNPDPVCWTHRHEAPEMEDCHDPAFPSFACRVCGVPKPYTSEYFAVDKHEKTGLRTICKACINAQNKRRYATDPAAAERRRERLRKRYRENPERRAKEREWQRQRRAKRATA